MFFMQEIQVRKIGVSLLPFLLIMVWETVSLRDPRKGWLSAIMFTCCLAVLLKGGRESQPRNWWDVVPKFSISN